MDRLFMGKPLRDISLICNPEPESLDSFCDMIKDGIEAYRQNMKHLKFTRTMYAETWMESFLGYIEIENE